jgi:tetratricopeptide (TPR) repeat protein
MTAAGPSLLVTVEDVHWASPVELDRIADLASAGVGLMALTSRLQGDPIGERWIRRAGRPLDVIKLSPLSVDEATAIARAVVGSDDARVSKAVERAAGHPLILEHLLAASGSEVTPGTVRTVVLARIDALAPTDRQALLCASVLGNRFDLDDLRAVLDDEGYLPTSLLAQDLLRRDGSWLDFGHALVRDVAYRALLRPQRSMLHRRAASSVAQADLALLAYHLGRAGDPGAPAAYLAAARAEAAAHHPEAAVDLADRGLALEATAEVGALTTIRADALLSLGRSRDALAAFESARELARDDQARLAALLGIGAALRLADRTADALVPIRAARDIARAIGALESLALALHLEGNALFTIDADLCSEAHHASLEAARAAGSPEAEARALGGLADLAYMRGDVRSGLELATACIEAARTLGLASLEAANGVLVAAFLLFNARIGEAHAEARRVFEVAHQAGNHRALAVVTVMLGFSSRLVADPDESIDFLDIGLAAAEAIAAPIRVAEIQMVGALLRSSRGDGADSLRELRAVVASNREHHVMPFNGPASLAALALVTPDVSERAALLAEGEALLMRGRWPHNHVEFGEYALSIALQAGDHDEVHRVAGQLRAYDSPLGDLYADTAAAAVATARGAPDASEQVMAVRARIEKAGARVLLRWLDGGSGP